MYCLGNKAGALVAALMFFAAPLSAATLQVIGPKTAEVNEEISFRLVYDIEWDIPVPQSNNPNVADIASHAQAGSMAVEQDGLLVATLRRPTSGTYTENPDYSGTPSGRYFRAGPKLDEWVWNYTTSFDTAGSYDLNFNSTGRFWRQVLGDIGVGFTGSDIIYLNENVSVTVTDTSVSVVPLPASGLLLLFGVAGLAAARRRKAV